MALAVRAWGHRSSSINKFIINSFLSNRVLVSIGNRHGFSTTCCPHYCRCYRRQYSFTVSVQLEPRLLLKKSNHNARKTSAKSVLAQLAAESPLVLGRRPDPAGNYFFSGGYQTHAGRKSYKTSTTMTLNQPYKSTPTNTKNGTFNIA